MIDKIMKLFRKEKLSNIRIQEKFKKHQPTEEKMAMKMAYYIIHNKFEQPIVVNKNNVLVDGYTTYLLASRMNKKYMPVKRISL